MGKFSSIVAGPKRRRTITLPFVGAEYDSIKNEWGGPLDTLDIRCLLPHEYNLVVEQARAFAKSPHAMELRDDDELYERGRMLYTLLITCVDKDSPLDAPTSYFETVEQMQESHILLDSTLHYLYQHQRMWQEECSPIRANLSEEEYLAGIITSAKGQTDFFVSMRPGTQWSCFARMASQLSSLMMRELQRSSQSESQPQNA